MEIFDYDAYRRVGHLVTSLVVATRPDLASFSSEVAESLISYPVGRAFILRSYFGEERPPLFVRGDIPEPTQYRWRVALETDAPECLRGYNEFGVYVRILAKQMGIDSLHDSAETLDVVEPYPPELVLRYAFLHEYFNTRITLPSYPEGVTLRDFPSLSRSTRDEVIGFAAHSFEDQFAHSRRISGLGDFGAMSLVGLLNQYASTQEIPLNAAVDTYLRLDRRMSGESLGGFILGVYQQSHDGLTERVICAPMERIIGYAFHSVEKGFVPNPAALNQYLKQTVPA